ncbi:MAG: ribosome biogenesis GTPase Der [Chthoniobacter sp.]|nr:ribosome biogenesis GTPase Der [Chthoniobacter sp.]
MPSTVAIVGRPNVGKSALFNRLAGRKISIVHDQPGVTRDRITAKCKLGKTPFEIIDTGGIGGDVDASFTDQVHAEVEIALAASDLLLFVVDGQDGITPVDLELAKRLRRIDKPLILVINKIDHDKHNNAPVEFSRLGFRTQIAISAEHNRGIGELVAGIQRDLPEEVESFFPPAENADQKPIKIAIVGRPNVGKSSLTNAILHDDRTLVSPISGTTRDAIDIPYERHGNRYVLIDTAGIRPRGKVDNVVEVFSVMRAESSIRRSDLCLLVIDATMGVTAQDKKIAGIIQEAKKPCVVAINKWDLIKDQTEDKEALTAVLDRMKAELFFLSYAPTMLVSAKTGAELTRLFKTIERVKSDAHQRIGTGVLNRLFTTTIALHPPTMRGGKRFKVLFVTQPEHDRPWPIPIPEFVLFVNDEKLLDDSYRRFIETHIREKAPYTGCPILFHFRARTPRDKQNETRGMKFGRHPETGGKSVPRGPRPKHSTGKAAKPRARLGG